MEQQRYGCAAPRRKGRERACGYERKGERKAIWSKENAHMMEQAHPPHWQTVSSCCCSAASLTALRCAMVR